MNNNKVVNLNNSESLYIRYIKCNLFDNYPTFNEYIDMVCDKVLFVLEQFDKVGRNKISELTLHEDKHIKRSVVAFLQGYSKEHDEEAHFVVFLNEINGESNIYKVNCLRSFSNCTSEEFAYELICMDILVDMRKSQNTYFFAEQMGFVINFEKFPS